MKASVTAHRDSTISEIDDRLYSAFIEHLGRAIYTGIYEPGHPTADKNGMRGDVAQLVRDLKVPYVRYPGGNFVSAYNWEDGVGPRDQRPTRIDLAWHTSDSNAVGTHEFYDWCELAGTKPMLAINLGSRGLDEARNLVEYVNGPTGSYWGDLRKKNGRADPFDVKLWCLGNEMDGPWQVGHKTADEYGRLASETAKTLRAFDKSLELVVCGSSNPVIATYPDWERVVLEHTYESVDHISLHMYVNNRANDTANYLAMSEQLDSYIATVASTIDFVKSKKRSKKNVTISFDEWNVWHELKAADLAILDGKDGWPYAPRLLEDAYNFEDVLQVGCILNTFIRRSNVVRIACIAQLVNAIAPIMTEPGGGAWKQATYYPYYFASNYGRGTALNLVVNSPAYDAEVADNVPYLDISGVHNEAENTITFFAVNRSADQGLELAIDLRGFAGIPRVVEHQVITHADVKTVNTMVHPNAVLPKVGSGVKVDGSSLAGNLAPHSYQMIRVKLQ